MCTIPQISLHLLVGNKKKDLDAKKKCLFFYWIFFWEGGGVLSFKYFKLKNKFLERFDDHFTSNFYFDIVNFYITAFYVYNNE